MATRNESDERVYTRDSIAAVFDELISRVPRLNSHWVRLRETVLDAATSPDTPISVIRATNAVYSAPCFQTVKFLIETVLQETEWRQSALSEVMPVILQNMGIPEIFVSFMAGNPLTAFSSILRQSAESSTEDDTTETTHFDDLGLDSPISIHSNTDESNLDEVLESDSSSYSFEFIFNTIQRWSRADFIRLNNIFLQLGRNHFAKPMLAHLQYQKTIKNVDSWELAVPRNQQPLIQLWLLKYLCDAPEISDSIFKVAIAPLPGSLDRLPRIVTSAIFSSAFSMGCRVLQSSLQTTFPYEKRNGVWCNYKNEILG